MSALDRYLAGRDEVLGQRVAVPHDPTAAAEALAEALGGPRAALRWWSAVCEALVDLR